jgi:DNA-binding response OmpR family regulator
MLTALDDDRDKIEGLELGADDYLTKPFNPNELVARVRAILRRSSRLAPASDSTERRATVTLGRACLDLAARRLTVDGDEVPLRTKEFDLLAALADRPDVVLTRDRLLERVWGGEFDGDTRTVDVHVSRLREKLASARTGIEIETVRAVGYRLQVRP